jgi:hypothetical protein
LVSMAPLSCALALGPAVRISTNTYYSLYPSVAAFDKYVYVAWSDNTPVSGSGSGSEIWMRVSSNLGVSFGSPIRITTNAGDSINPSVAAYYNYVYVAWQDDTPVSGSGAESEIWMRVSSNYGASFGSAIRITTNAGFSGEPSVAAVGSYVYVAWEDNTPPSGSPAGLTEIWFRASLNNGASFSPATRISTNTGASEYPSVAAYVYSGSYVYVAWQDDTSVSGSGGNPEIWMRVSSNSGASFGSAIRISTNTYSSEYPSVAASGADIYGTVYVAWMDDTPVWGSGDKTEIWFRMSSNHGASFGSPIRITTNTGFSGEPSVAAIGSYVYLAWEDSTPVSGSGSTYEIWMRVSSNYGASFGSAIRITTNTGFSRLPSVAAMDSHFYIAWMDNTPVPGSGIPYEIWLRAGS